ncbi:MAG: hypothetical protein E6Q50_06030 [Lysobacter sp.]|nr:MAG: hypothetical protein E6Q50_06030 [Lysobacter sp.]
MKISFGMFVVIAILIAGLPIAKSEENSHLKHMPSYLTCKDYKCMNFSIVFENAHYCTAVAFPVSEKKAPINDFIDFSDIYISAKMGKIKCNLDYFFSVYGYEVESVQSAVSVLDKAMRNGASYFDVTAIDKDIVRCFFSQKATHVKEASTNFSAEGEGYVVFVISGCQSPVDAKVTITKSRSDSKIVLSYSNFIVDGVPSP